MEDKVPLTIRCARSELTRRGVLPFGECVRVELRSGGQRELSSCGPAPVLIYFGPFVQHPQRAYRGYTHYSMVKPGLFS